MAETRMPSTRNFTLGSAIRRFNVNVTGSTLHRAQQNRVEQFDDGTLIFTDLIDRQDFLAPFVLFDQHRSILGFQFAQRLTRPFATFQGRQNRSLRADDQLQLASEEQFKFIDSEKILGIRDCDSQAALQFGNRYERVALHQLDGYAVIKRRFHTKIGQRVEGQSKLDRQRTRQLFF